MKLNASLAGKGVRAFASIAERSIWSTPLTKSRMVSAVAAVLPVSPLMNVKTSLPAPPES